MKQGKAKFTQYDNGKIVVEPYEHTEQSRYTPLMELEYGSLTTTQSHYRVLLKFPRKEGIMECVKHLLRDATRIGNFLTEIYIKSDK